MLMIWSPTSFRGVRECTRQCWAVGGGCHGHMKRNVHASKNDCGGMVVRCRGVNIQFCSQPEMLFLNLHQVSILFASRPVANMLDKLCWWKFIVRSSHRKVELQINCSSCILPPIFTKCSASSTVALNQTRLTILESNQKCSLWLPMIWSPTSFRGARECTRHVWLWMSWSYEKECACFKEWLWWNGCEMHRSQQTVL